MQKFPLLFLITATMALALTFQVHAQMPPKIYSIAVEKHEFDWYKSAAEDWGKILQKDSTDANAWMNLYMSSRIMKMWFTDEWSKIPVKASFEPRDIASKVKHYVPAAFERYFIEYSDSHDNGPGDTTALFKAYSLGSDRVELYPSLLAYFEVHRDTVKKHDLCIRWMKSGAFSPGILNWNYNVLASLAPNSIIVTNGDNDTFPIWILQEAFNFRKDVTAINISLNYIDAYRDKLYAEQKIKPFVLDWNMVMNFDTTLCSNPESPVAQMIAKRDTMGYAYYAMPNYMIKHLMLNTSPRNFYIALTVLPEFYEVAKEKMYLTGLAFQYSGKDIDNTALLINNYENNWLLDYLTHSFCIDKSVDIVNQLNVNYLPVFSQLYKHFKTSGQMEKMAKVKSLAKLLTITKDGREYFESHFDKSDPLKEN